MLMTILLQASPSLDLSFLSAFAAVFAALGAAFGISKIGVSAVEGIARQPEAGENIRMSLLIAAALIEGATLFAIIVCFLIS